MHLIKVVLGRPVDHDDLTVVHQHTATGGLWASAVVLGRREDREHSRPFRQVNTLRERGVGSEDVIEPGARQELVHRGSTKAHGVLATEGGTEAGLIELSFLGLGGRVGPQAVAHDLAEDFVLGGVGVEHDRHGLHGRQHVGVLWHWTRDSSMHTEDIPIDHSRERQPVEHTVDCLVHFSAELVAEALAALVQELSLIHI
eukprot:TRINITY_DN753_c0_g1_i4.p1 TRINITY_DN753_c0_g1~~TRINITY_DN753_c0_g1_i4.p1  ORF type:complete len:200 (+),score=18.23 TRINITY_DN753_c0_g1_i4:225-824(+)